MNFTNKLRGVSDRFNNTDPKAGESDIARRARDLVDGTGRSGQFSNEEIDREHKRRIMSGVYSQPNHSALQTREDALPGGGQGSFVGAAKEGTIEKPRPRDLEQERAALEERLQKQGKSSDMIRFALETFDQTHEQETRLRVEKVSRNAAREHAKATHDYHEENRTDAVTEYPVDRARREAREDAEQAWMRPVPGDDNDNTSEDETGDVVADARARAEADARNAWRTKPE